MSQGTPVYKNPSCEILETTNYLHCIARSGHANDVQECYRALATECLQRHGKRILVVGSGNGDSFIHLAGRDALRALATAGLPPSFRLALVPKTSDMIAIYDAVVVRAGRHGITAKRFPTEKEAVAWLDEP